MMDLNSGIVPDVDDVVVAPVALAGGEGGDTALSVVRMGEFDYEAIADLEARRALQDLEAKAQRTLQNAVSVTASAVLEFGRILLTARDEWCIHGEFQRWVEQSFKPTYGIEYRKAVRWMGFVKAGIQVEDIELHGLSVLYQLTSGRDEVVEESVAWAQLETAVGHKLNNEAVWEKKRELAQEYGPEQIRVLLEGDMRRYGSDKEIWMAVLEEIAASTQSQEYDSFLVWVDGLPDEHFEERGLPVGWALKGPTVKAAARSLMDAVAASIAAETADRGIKELPSPEKVQVEGAAAWARMKRVVEALFPLVYLDSDQTWVIDDWTQAREAVDFLRSPLKMTDIDFALDPGQWIAQETIREIAKELARGINLEISLHEMDKMTGASSGANEAPAQAPAPPAGVSGRSGAGGHQGASGASELVYDDVPDDVYVDEPDQVDAVCRGCAGPLEVEDPDGDLCQACYDRAYGGDPDAEPGVGDFGEAPDESDLRNQTLADFVTKIQKLKDFYLADFEEFTGNFDFRRACDQAMRDARSNIRR